MLLLWYLWALFGVISTIWDEGGQKFITNVDICQGRYCPCWHYIKGVTLCQVYVKGGGPCWLWLPLFDVKDIFYILLIKSEYMSTLCQWSIVNVDVMSRVCQGKRSMLTLVTTFWCKTYILYFINKKWIHVDVMSREILSMLKLNQGSRSMSTQLQFVSGRVNITGRWHLVPIRGIVTARRQRVSLSFLVST